MYATTRATRGRYLSRKERTNPSCPLFNNKAITAQGETSAKTQSVFQRPSSQRPLRGGQRLPSPPKSPLFGKHRGRLIASWPRGDSCQTNLRQRRGGGKRCAAVLGEVRSVWKLPDLHSALRDFLQAARASSSVPINVGVAPKVSGY